MSLAVVGELRHACVGCGGSCRGVRVAVTPEEAARIEALAPGLGVLEPVRDGALRRVDGACVFLDAAARCRVHARHGALAKPAICRQYPAVATATEDGVVVGIDPGCYRHLDMWRDAPPVTDGSLQAARHPLPPEARAAEAAVLGWLGAPEATVARAIRLLLGSPPGVDLPGPFAARLAHLLRDAPLGAVLGDASFGDSFRGALRPLDAARGGWDAPPPWPAIGPEEEAFALDAARRLVALRLLPRLGGPVGAALLSLTGAVAVGWASPDRGSFGAGLAAWSRGLRAPRFVAALLPDPQRLRWLVGAPEP